MIERVSIRRATIADVKCIVRLSHDGTPDGVPKKPLPDNLPEGYYQAFRRIENDQNQFLMVAELDGIVVGTFQLTFISYLAGAGREDCQVESVHVDGKWRGQGIGTLMMNWAIHCARKRGCRRLQLTSHKARKAAHRFYEKLGFSLSHEGAKLSIDDNTE